MQCSHCLAYSSRHPRRITDGAVQLCQPSREEVNIALYKDMAACDDTQGHKGVKKKVLGVLEVS